MSILEKDSRNDQDVIIVSLENGKNKRFTNRKHDWNANANSG
jgi:hypothetical protein